MEYASFIFFTTVFTKIVSWLQGVGLKLDDALAFWKAEFSRKVSMTRYLCHINWESVDSIPYFITPKNMPYIVSNSEISFENLAAARMLSWNSAVQCCKNSQNACNWPSLSVDTTHRLWNQSHVFFSLQYHSSRLLLKF